MEIVSPGSRGTNHVMKLHEYAKAGIANYWIVDSDAPAYTRFLAYRLDAGNHDLWLRRQRFGNHAQQVAIDVACDAIHLATEAAAATTLTASASPRLWQDRTPYRNSDSWRVFS